MMKPSHKQYRLGMRDLPIPLYFKAEEIALINYEMQLANRQNRSGFLRELIFTKIRENQLKRAEEAKQHGKN